jgi:hypothetical protein
MNGTVIPDSDGSIHRIDTLAETRRVLRLRHYSYRTEQTYLEWIERFFEYLRETGATWAFITKWRLFWSAAA